MTGAIFEICEVIREKTLLRIIKKSFFPAARAARMETQFSHSSALIALIPSHGKSLVFPFHRVTVITFPIYKISK